MEKFLDKHNDLSKNAFLSLVVSIFLVEFGFESSSFTQNVFVGQNLDTIHYSIYGLAYNYTTFLYVLSVMAATGTQTAIVALLAKGNKKQAQGTFFLSVVINVALTIVIIFLVHLFAENIAWLFGARDDAISLLPETAAYLRIISISTPAFCLSMLLPQIAMLQGGQKYIYLYALSMLLLTIIGCIINFWVINGDLLSLGIVYDISAYLALSVMIVHFANKNNTFNFYPKKLDLRLFIPVMRQSLPDFILGICLIVFPLIVNAIILQTGNAIIGIAVFTIQVSFKDLIVTVTSGIGAAVLVMFRLYSTQRDFRECRRVINFAIITILVIIIPISLLIVIFSQNIAQLYSQDPDILQYAPWAILALSVFLPFFTLSRVFVRIFHALNHNTMAMFLNITSYLIFPVLCVVFLTAKFGLYGLIWALPLSQIAQVMFSLIAILFDKWILKNTNKLCPLDCFTIKDNPVFAFKAKKGDRIDDNMETVNEFLSKYNVDKNTYNMIHLCLETMLYSIIKYQDSLSKNNRVDVAIILSETDIFIRIRDNCPQLVSDKIYDQAIVKNSDYLEEEKISVELIKNITSNIEHEYIINFNSYLLTLTN